MFRSTLVLLSALLATTTLACGAAAPEGSVEDGNPEADVELASGAATSNGVTLQGKHKSPNYPGALSTSLFLVKTKEGDLFKTQDAILKAITPNNVDHRLTITPGTYDLKVGSGEYIVLGSTDRTYFDGRTNDVWIETRLSISGNKLSVSSLSTLFVPATQSDPVLETNNVLFLAQGTYLTGPIKYEYKDSKTIRVTVPPYNANIKF